MSNPRVPRNDNTDSDEDSTECRTTEIRLPHCSPNKKRLLRFVGTHIYYIAGGLLFLAYLTCCPSGSERTITVVSYAKEKLHTQNDAPLVIPAPVSSNLNSKKDLVLEADTQILANSSKELALTNATQITETSVNTALVTSNLTLPDKANSSNETQLANNATLVTRDSSSLVVANSSKELALTNATQLTETSNNTTIVTGNSTSLDKASSSNEIQLAESSNNTTQTASTLSPRVKDDKSNSSILLSNETTMNAAKKGSSVFSLESVYYKSLVDHSPSHHFLWTGGYFDLESKEPYLLRWLDNPTDAFQPYNNFCQESREFHEIIRRNILASNTRRLHVVADFRDTRQGCWQIVNENLLLPEQWKLPFVCTAVQPSSTFP